MQKPDFVLQLYITTGRIGMQNCIIPGLSTGLCAMVDGVVSMCSKVPCLKEQSFYIKKMDKIRLPYFTDAKQKIREADTQVYKCWLESPKLSSWKVFDT